MKTIRRLAKMTERKVKRTWKEFVVDTLVTVLFWLVVHVLKDVLIVRMSLWQVFVAAVSGIILNLSLGGVYGQILNLARRLAGCQNRS